MKYTFYKYHGCGNDYIYFDAIQGPFPDISLIPLLCNPHTGIGGDGVVFICTSEVAHGRMVMYNKDGSRGSMCGNAIRCIAKHLREIHGISSPILKIETDVGIRSVVWDADKDEYCVDMGKPDLRSVAKRTLYTPWGEVVGYDANMGNPHFVVFQQDEPLPFDAAAYVSASVPGGTNVEFVRQKGKEAFFYRVYERGSGETLSCGSGACAIGLCSVSTNLCREDVPISIASSGGTLTITVSQNAVFLKGPATRVFIGTLEANYSI